MDKILDSEFRQTLYKNLVDAGYEKKEAQKIVGVKYHAALKADLIVKFDSIIDEINSENYDVQFNADEFNDKKNDGKETDWGKVAAKL